MFMQCHYLHPFATVQQCALNLQSPHPTFTSVHACNTGPVTSYFHMSLVEPKMKIFHLLDVAMVNGICVIYDWVCRGGNNDSLPHSP